MKMLLLMISFCVTLIYCDRQDLTQGKPDIFSAGYPKAFFFRRAESFAASGKYSYDEWKVIFNRLYGIQGKVLTEELPDRSKYNLEYFTCFKNEYPEQIVLLHFNGNARDPRYESEKYFAGHWAYYQGCKNISEIPAQEGIMEIEVEDASLYRTGLGRFNDRNEDIGICLLDSAGGQNWYYSEQVELVSVDRDRNTIKIKRGCFGTKPLQFPAGKAWLAAHIHEGPWRESAHMLWYYNHSTNSPVDSSGKRCSEILALEIASWFEKDGILSSFDGLELDVLMSEVTAAYKLGDRKADLDCDGVPDNGIFDGVNTYSLGVLKFSKDLREFLAKDKLYMADSFKKGHQRAFGILNGIESEGWPALFDPEINLWDEGLNRLAFWRINSREPKFGYINHKWGRKFKPVPYSRHRLVMAVSTFTDYAICYLADPIPEGGEEYGIWDELKKGVENEKGWLGQPVSGMQRLALQAPDILDGQGKRLDGAFLKRISGAKDVLISEDLNSLKITASQKDGTAQGKLRITLRNIKVDGPDLFVSFKIKGDSLKNYTKEVGRLLFAGIQETGESQFNFGVKSWFNQDWFQIGLYFRDVKADKVNLLLEMEGNEPVWISEITMRAFPDIMIREFENGVVLANPSLHDYSFDLPSLFPGQSFKRLMASSKQDTSFNNGETVGSLLTLGERDAIFLIKEK